MSVDTTFSLTHPKETHSEKQAFYCMKTRTETIMSMIKKPRTGSKHSSKDKNLKFTTSGPPN